MKMKWWPVVLIAALSLCAGTAFAGQIDPGLAEVLQGLQPDEQVKVILIMEEQFNTPELVADLGASEATLAERHEEVLWALQDAAEFTQAPVLDMLQTAASDGSIQRVRPMWIANMIALTIRAGLVPFLADMPGVREVTWDAPLALVEPVSEQPAGAKADGVEPGLEAINAHLLWAQGFTGAGVLVCNLDTGVDGNHEALADRWRGTLPGVTPAEAWFDPVSSTSFPFDSATHGTHTMGTICGKSGDDIIGVAYDALWIAAGVIDRVSIERTYSDAALAFQWAADPDGNPGTIDDVPAVISNSWGLIPVTHGRPACDDTLWSVIDNCEAAGATVVFAAGNEGSSAKTIRVPADRITTAVNTFAVGALQQGGTAIASFSSRGPSKCDDATIKPEVCAVGDNVRSSVPGGYSTMSGTSMACPHVAGAVALLKHVNPNATPEQIKTALYMTAVDLGDAGEDNTYGRGRIDLQAAANYLGYSEDYGKIEGTVTDQYSNPVTWARINVEGTPLYTSTNQDGEYMMYVMGGQTVTLNCTAFGYEDATETGVEVVAQQTTIVDFQLTARPKGLLTGTVTEDKGSPIVNATISFPGTPVDPVTTNDQGQYSVNLPGDYTYSVKASASGFDSETQDIYVYGYGIHELNFALKEDACLFKAAARGSDRIMFTNRFHDMRYTLERSDKGAEFVEMYYRNGHELVRIFASHPSLWAPTREAVDRLEVIADRLDSAYAPHDAMPLLDSNDVEFFLALIDGYMQYSDSDLAADLEFVAATLEDLENRTPAEVMRWIEGPMGGVVIQPQIETDHLGTYYYY